MHPKPIQPFIAQVADTPVPARRQLIAGAAVTAAAALLPLRRAVAQTAARGGDWLAMFKAQHLLVDQTFKELLDSTDKTFLRRQRLQRTLAYQLTAHSVAEENVLYPAIARLGLVTEADKLYLDQAHAKVMNAELELTNVQESGAWQEKVSALQAAVLQHARQDEEARLYPQLQQKLDATTNAVLTAAFAREFASVHPEKGLPLAPPPVASPSRGG